MTNKTINIAIVEDSEIIRERITERLSKIEGIKIIWQAKDLPESFTFFNEHEPDAVILDIQLPGGNGIELLEHIKKHNSKIITIMLTNYPIGLFRKKCCCIGADYFFDKSSEFEKVFTVLKKMSLGEQIEKKLIIN